MGFCWQSFVFEDLGGGLANAWKPLDVSQSFIRSNNKKTTWVGVYYFEVKLQTQKKDVLLLLYTKLNVVTSTPPTLRRPVTNDYRAHQQRPKRRVLPPHARQFPPKTFSDWFEPRCAADYQFQLIGTAVSPLVGKAVGRSRKAYLKNVEEYDKNRIVKFQIGPLPISKNLALPWLITLVRAAYSKTLRRAPEGDFKRGWCSVALLYSGLDLDSALEHKAKTADGMENWLEAGRLDAGLIGAYYVQSGWPVLLEHGAGLKLQNSPMKSFTAARQSPRLSARESARITFVSDSCEKFAEPNL